MRLLAVLLSAALAFAQKRPLTVKDFDSWRSIHDPKLSRDGRIAAYALFPQVGDGEVVIRQVPAGKDFHVPVGARPVRQDDDDPSGDGRPAPFVYPLALTHDGKWAVALAYPAKADTDKARKEKKKPEQMPKTGLVIVDAATGVVSPISDAAAFQLSENSDWLAYKRNTATGGPSVSAAPAGVRRGGGGRRPTAGSELVLRNLATGAEMAFADVTEYSLSKDGKSLVYVVAPKKDGDHAVFHVMPGSTGGNAIATGKKRFAGLAWDDKQGQLAFAGDGKLYHWNRGGESAATLVGAKADGLPTGYAVSDRGQISFSRDGSRVFFGSAKPAPDATEPAEADPERVQVDLWHWKDDHVQPMQKIRAEQERNRTYRAVYHLGDKKLVQLADGNMTEATPNEDGSWAAGADDKPYRPMVEYDQRYSDTYLVNTVTGERKLIVKKNRNTPTWAPDGKHLIYFDGRDWQSVAVATAETVNLTKGIGVAFFNEEDDHPATPPAYGSAGWARDGKSVLLYDMYDIWQIPADGGSARNVTGGIGRKGKVQFRLQRFPDEGRDRGVDTAKPLLLRAENMETRESGFWRVQMGGAPEKLVMTANSFLTPVKARDADVLLVTRGSFAESNDLWITNSAFSQLSKLSDSNPQQKNFSWGTAELVHYRNTDGVKLSGVLYKPENFDPAKKYPLIVYIYERLSDRMFRYLEPRPTNSINIPHYVSNGYLILTPDIVYTPGYPGPSAMKCVMPAVDALVDKGFVDEKAIGIQGHSWGGYQIAYMITQTDRFRAVSAGAPVANMTSAYDGIRWGSGLPRQFQYEKSQSRIGGSLWEYPMRFLDNSPIFRADRVKTPLLMIHNDADDAVPWYQGIEYYLALRRLDKEVYLFSYNGEPHNLRKRVNQVDYTTRMFEYFDYFLKGAAKPEWMARGIPFIEKK